MNLAGPIRADQPRYDRPDQEAKRNLRANRHGAPHSGRSARRSRWLTLLCLRISATIGIVRVPSRPSLLE